MKTNLTVLHRVPEIINKVGTGGRCIGKTYYACHCVAGYLQVLQNEVITVFVPNSNYLKHWISTLTQVLKDYEIEIEFTDFSSRRVFIKNNTNSIKFLTPDVVAKVHPSDFQVSPDLYPILDIDNLGPNFWKETNDLTVRDFEKIVKIRNQYFE